MLGKCFDLMFITASIAMGVSIGMGAGELINDKVKELINKEK